MNMSVVCPSCDGIAQAVTRERDVEIGRWSARVDDAFFRCPACNQEFYEPGQLDATLEKAARLVRERRGLVAPQGIRSLRARYGLTQEQLEKMLRVAPKTVVRWERGTVLPTQATSLLLQVLSDVPAAIFSVAATRGVELKISPPPQLRLIEVSKPSRFESDAGRKEGAA